MDEIVTSDDTERTVSHFIPSVELTGSRGEKLRKLDTLILYLAQLRRSLARDATRKPQICGENAAGVERAAWVRFTQGSRSARSPHCCCSSSAGGPYDFFTKS